MTMSNASQDVCVADLLLEGRGTATDDISVDAGECVDAGTWSRSGRHHSRDWRVKGSARDFRRQPRLGNVGGGRGMS